MGIHDEDRYSSKSIFGSQPVASGQPLKFNHLQHRQIAGIFHTNLLDAHPTVEALKGAAVGAGVGATSGAAYSWWLGTGFREGLKLIGRQVGWLGVLGAASVGSATYTAHLREKDDVWNAPAGAAVAGALLGLRSGSTVKIFLHPAALFTLTLYLETLRRSNFWHTQSKKGACIDVEGAYKFGRSDPYLSKVARSQ